MVHLRPTSFGDDNMTGQRKQATSRQPSAAAKGSATTAALSKATNGWWCRHGPETIQTNVE